MADVGPLRERDDDLVMLVQYYLRRFNRELGREVREIAPEGLERLRGYPWPGNVRELQSVLKQAMLKASGPVLLPDFPPEPLGGVADVTPPEPMSEEPGVETFVIRQRVGSDVRDLYAETHRQVDRLLLPRVLEHTLRQSFSKTARSCWGSFGKYVRSSSETWGCPLLALAKRKKTKDEGFRKDEG